jgi:hypothetical protein
MENKEQGVYLDCIYCKVIYPEINSSNCKRCKGEGGYFRPARMMDKLSSNNYVMDSLKQFFENYDMYEEIDESNRKRMIGLVEIIEIYNFDLKKALIDIIRN